MNGVDVKVSQQYRKLPTKERLLSVHICEVRVLYTGITSLIVKVDSFNSRISSVKTLSSNPSSASEELLM